MRFRLSDAQVQVESSRAPELLIEHAPGEGASFCLRALLLIRAIACQGSTIALVASDPSALERDHFSGPGSFWLLALQLGRVFGPGQGGKHRIGRSTIHVIPWEKASSVKADIWLIDGLESVSAVEYAELRA